MKSLALGLQEALRLTLEALRPLGEELLPLLDGVDRVAARDLHALVDSPTRDVSRKDGYALQAREVAAASAQAPVRLRVLGAMAAGGAAEIAVAPGSTVRVLTGARIPPGADLVVAEEHVKREGDEVVVGDLDRKVPNILRRGGDIAQGRLFLERGQVITPIMAGLLAAAGYSQVPVHRTPLVGLVGTGDEIVAPGEPLAEGKLYASNIVALAGWCARYKMPTRTAIVRDHRPAMREAFAQAAEASDALITSGGAWRGDHDIVADVLGELGWEMVFHRIRIGPGKAVGFGMMGGKPVFVLPGGPPSNLIGFLQIALPGLLALGGHAQTGLPTATAQLAEGIDGGKPAWTDFFFGALTPGEDMPLFHPMDKRARLVSIAAADAVAAIPEGRDRLEAGEVVLVQLLR
jgi:molybdopterin molybdotransferase